MPTKRRLQIQGCVFLAALAAEVLRADQWVRIESFAPDGRKGKRAPWPRLMRPARKPPNRRNHCPSCRLLLKFPTRPEKGFEMVKWALVFLVVGLIAGVLGFTGIAGAAIGIAKLLFFIAIALFVVMLLLGVTVFKKVA